MKKLSIDEMKRLSVEEFKRIEKLPIVVVLDNIRSQHNIGAVFRTADAFLIGKLFLCGITAVPPNREINKSALGATESVEWEYAENTAELVRKLKQEKYTIIALEQAHGSVSIDTFLNLCPSALNSHFTTHTVAERSRSTRFNPPIALIIGNEVNGVSGDVMDIVDVCLEIPQHGTKHSLNVSVSAGIAMYMIRTMFTQTDDGKN